MRRSLFLFLPGCDAVPNLDGQKGKLGGYHGLRRGKRADPGSERAKGRGGEAKGTWAAGGETSYFSARQEHI